eukprot:TRINITY_DN13271_c0_g1_i3.p2 TRINITY_DN13271_c0_g1~~TRINITY_DN13271_c0_g1_i3.p2  ORF type:complete len:147 (+),score=22.28 TRINITY_DN13271_c0_g1_i3:56-442(+)
MDSVCDLMVVELQFHGTGNRQNGAHAVVYMYKVPGGGVGVVISYKGSTLNPSDWVHNVQVWSPEYLLQGRSLKRAQRDQKPEGYAQVHKGFLKYKRSLDHKMQKFSMHHLAETLASWGGAQASTGESL